MYSSSSFGCLLYGRLTRTEYNRFVVAFLRRTAFNTTGEIKTPIASIEPRAPPFGTINDNRILILPCQVVSSNCSPPLRRQSVARRIAARVAVLRVHTECVPRTNRALMDRFFCGTGGVRIMLFFVDDMYARSRQLSVFSDVRSLPANRLSTPWPN